MAANLPTLFVADRPGTVLGQWDDVDVETGEMLRRARVLLFGVPAGRDRVCEPELAVVTVTGEEQTGPARPRHTEARLLAGWLAAQRRMVDSRQADMLRVLVELTA